MLGEKGKVTLYKLEIYFSLYVLPKMRKFACYSNKFSWAFVSNADAPTYGTHARALWDMTNDFDSSHFATHAIALEMLFGIHIDFWNKYQPRETPGFGDISA